MRTQKGFTLIELMVVIALIGILIGIAVPGYRSYIERTDRAQTMSDLEDAAQAMERFRTVRFTFAGATPGSASTDTIPSQSPRGGTAKYTISFIDTDASTPANDAGPTFVIMAKRTDGMEVFGIDNQGRRCYKKGSGLTTCSFTADQKWEDAD